MGQNHIFPNFSDSKRARVRIPVGAKKFSDGTCKYLPYAELHLCLNYTFVSLCEGLRAGAGSLSYIVHVDCCGLSTIVIKNIIIIIIILRCH